MTLSLTIDDLTYELPKDRIASFPVSQRSAAKLLVIEANSYSHRHVSDLPELLPSDALIVVNETAVLPARFQTLRVDTGGKVEGLFLEQLEDDQWVVMLKSNGKLHAGIELKLSDSVVLELVHRDGAIWNCRCSDPRHAEEILALCGTTPLPPYILSARGDTLVDDSRDRQRYQTIYADMTQCHSIAAPTAGLHFDEELLERLDMAGFNRVPITLHVGAGTFKAIETAKIEDHKMHQEQWKVSQGSIDLIREAKLSGQPIVAIGTTSVRTLESLPPIEDWPITGGLSGSTRLMITPPYDFRVVDGLVTNFHLPKSTLLALVASMIGIDRLMESYQEAIKTGYRFYSYGDAMFIPPQISTKH